ncbi:MAG: GNAT family N-acetyltransferase [Akkermansia sp.]|nr:GNAT family N-acetyltransferase [Akkermansia sp.]
MSAGPWQIRPARESDLPALLEIYNHAVVNSVATFDLEPRTQAAGRAWLSAHTGRHPLAVAKLHGTVAGYASLSPYRPMPAYDSTAELSLYIHPDYRRQGLGRALAEHILEFARAEESLHLVVSVITASHAVSLALHDKLGFRRCGTLHEAGFKFGAYHDVVHLELRV